MRLPSAACPNCNSPQRFAPKQRQLAPDTIEIYAACHMCREEIFIEQVTPTELRNRRHRARRLRAGSL